MFYKYDFDTEGKEFINDNPLEFALVLSEKFKDFSEYETGFLKAIDKNNQNVFLKPIFWSTKTKRYMTKDGERELTKYFMNSLSKKNPEFTDFSLISSSLSHLKSNSVIKNKMEKLLEDFFNLKVKKEVIDKNGQKYTIKIVNNADDTIGASLIVDSLFLYCENEKVGYLKVKYTKEATFDKFYKDKNSPDAKSDKLFINLASVDYSRLEDEYRNKGLGYVMYFHMAQHLENEGIKFRSSTIQSPFAKRLWDGISKNWSAQVECEVFGKEKCCFLKMTKELELYFENNNPKVKILNRI